MSKQLTGVVASIDLTFGGLGNQNMVIDGERYATWIDHTKWPKIGQTVTHEPYVVLMDGRSILSTRILEYHQPESPDKTDEVPPRSDL